MRLNLLLATAAAVVAAAPMTVQVHAQAQTRSPVAAPGPTAAPVQDVVVDEGVLKPFQIAIAPFSGANGSDISSVLTGDLTRSGYFEAISPNRFIETGLTLANAPNFQQWTNIGAQAVLYGSVTPASRRSQQRRLSALRPLSPVPADFLPVHCHARAVAPDRAQDRRRRLSTDDRLRAASSTPASSMWPRAGPS